MLKMGIVGLGKMGAIHTTWLTPENQLELVAICENNEARIQQIKDEYGVPVYREADEHDLRQHAPHDRGRRKER
jgi:predicted dehydrogenase